MCKSCHLVYIGETIGVVGSPKPVPQRFCSLGHQGSSDMEVLGLRVWRETYFRNG